MKIDSAVQYIIVTDGPGAWSQFTLPRWPSQSGRTAERGGKVQQIAFLAVHLPIGHLPYRPGNNCLLVNKREELNPE